VSTAKYSAIYSGFAIVLIFMIWLYFNWIIMLVGVKIAFYHQFPAMLCIRQDHMIFSERSKYRLSLIIMYLISLHYYKDLPRWTLHDLTRYLKIPSAPMLEVTQALQSQRLLLFLPEDGTFLPARDIDTITIHDVFYAVQQTLSSDTFLGVQIDARPEIEQVIGKMEAGIVKNLSEDTIKTLILSAEHQNGNCK
jgi:membrane protein